MKLSLETNISITEAVEPVTDFDFCLAHLMEDRRYREYYMTLQSRQPDRLMILDNGVHEVRIPLTTQELFSIAEEIDATLVIPPDYIRNMIKTRDGCIEALQIFPKERLLPVVQGRTVEECIESGLWYIDAGFKRLAVPCSPHLDREVGLKALDLDRRLIVDSLLMDLPEGSDFSWVHLLGMCTLEELQYYDDATYEITFSMDTGVPYLHARNGRLLGVQPLFPKGKPHVIDYEETLSKEDIGKVGNATIYNLAYMRRIVNAGR